MEKFVLPQQPTDLVPPEVSGAEQELHSARSPGVVEGGQGRVGEADVCRHMLIEAVFLLQNRCPLICRHGNANKYPTLPVLLFH
jgi:hypothetical protein